MKGSTPPIIRTQQRETVRNLAKIITKLTNHQQIRNQGLTPLPTQQNRKRNNSVLPNQVRGASLVRVVTC